MQMFIQNRDQQNATDNKLEQNIYTSISVSNDGQKKIKGSIERDEKVMPLCHLFSQNSYPYSRMSAWRY